jgi:isocitrate dehydrogenase
MMKIAVVNGDGIGPEIMAAVIDVFNASQIPLQYHYADRGKWVFELN